MSTAPKVKPELVEKIGQLAAETGSSPEELTAALDDYRARLEALRAEIDEGISSGDPVDGEAFLRELLEETKALIHQRGR